MKKTLYILVCLVFIGVSCKKQEVLEKNKDSSFTKKGHKPVIVETEDEEDTSSTKTKIVETEDEEDTSNGKKKKDTKK